MKILTKEEILEKTIPYQQNKNLYVYEVWTEIHKAMQSYSDQENARLTAINEKQSELIKRFLKGNLQIPIRDYSLYQKLNDELFSLKAGEKKEIKKDKIKSPCDSCNANPLECKSCGSGTRSNNNADEYYETQ